MRLMPECACTEESRILYIIWKERTYDCNLNYIQHECNRLATMLHIHGYSYKGLMVGWCPSIHCEVQFSFIFLFLGGLEVMNRGDEHLPASSLPYTFGRSRRPVEHREILSCMKVVVFGPSCLHQYLESSIVDYLEWPETLGDPMNHCSPAQ